MSEARRLWGAPVVIALASVVGLVSGLLGDGAWDALSWVTLSGVIAITLWHSLRPYPGRAPGRSDDA